jgi:hypothetical protein
VIGLISPRLRLWEPAVGAALSVGLTLVFTWFTPITFVHYSGGRLLLGSGLAFLLALAGARTGERLMGNL